MGRRVISLFTHAGELVLDPFVGSGTMLIAARDLGRNAIGFDLQAQYLHLCEQRLGPKDPSCTTQQLAVQADARNIPAYLEPETVALVWTSPLYANTLNRRFTNIVNRMGNF